MANLDIKSVLGLSIILIAVDVSFSIGEEEGHFENSEEESKIDGLERFPRHDQNQDSITPNDDSVPFANENPGNFFMIQQVFKEGDYDVGYRRGNEDHVKEYRQVANPNTGHFKIMARWGDKNGGYGEQYWDYNHGGPDEHDELNEDHNGESSLSVRSPSINSSPSAYNIVGESQETTSAVPLSTAYPKSRHPKKSRKRYEEPRRDSLKIPEASSTDGSYFVLPRASPRTEQTALHQMNDDNGPLRIHLYEPPSALPTAYDNYLQITQSTPKLRANFGRY